MAAKYINEEIWKKVEKKLVEAVIETKQSWKDADILRVILEIGLENVNKEDYWNHIRSKENS